MELVMKAISAVKRRLSTNRSSRLYLDPRRRMLYSFPSALKYNILLVDGRRVFLSIRQDAAFTFFALINHFVDKSTLYSDILPSKTTAPFIS